MSKYIKFLFLFLMCALFSACASVEHKQVRTAFYNSDYASAAPLAREYKNSADAKDFNLALLDAGFVLASCGYNADSAILLSSFLRSDPPADNSDFYKACDTERLAASYSLALSCLAVSDKASALKTLEFAENISAQSPQISAKKAEDFLKRFYSDSEFALPANILKSDAFCYNVKSIYKTGEFRLDFEQTQSLLTRAYQMPIFDLIGAIIGLCNLKSVEDIDFVQNKFAEAARKMPRNLFLLRNVKMLNDARKNGFVPNMTFIFFESGAGAIKDIEKIEVPRPLGDGEFEFCEGLFSLRKYSQNFDENLGVLSDGKFYRPLLICDLDGAKRLEELALLHPYIADKVTQTIQNGGAKKVDARASFALPCAVYYASVETPKSKKIFIDGLKVELSDAPINIVRVRKMFDGDTSSVQVYPVR